LTILLLLVVVLVEQVQLLTGLVLLVVVLVVIELLLAHLVEVQPLNQNCPCHYQPTTQSQSELVELLLLDQETALRVATQFLAQ
jgi:hypothetical protein